MQVFSIFAYDIDFALDIRNGDSFTVIYDERFLNGEKLKDGPIQAVEFVNKGKTFAAYRYTDTAGNSDYYDENGRSLRKAFIRTPIKFARISSHFNPSRLHPILHTIRAHKGVDYAAPTGTPIKATGSGKVIFKGRKNGYGKTVILQHGKTYTTLYAHMSNFDKKLAKGGTVQQGQIIGYVGQTGGATGPHLHYEFRLLLQNPNSCDLPNKLVKSPSSFPRRALRLPRNKASQDSQQLYIGLMSGTTTATPSSWQIGNPNLITEILSIPVVCDFRRRDIAAGGQGAPLVPAFHQFLFKTRPLAVLNLGGIANLTLISADGKITGFDTGPANTLLDSWIKKHKSETFDANGRWAQEGSADADLLTLLADHPYFKQTPPKSTGREVFNLDWLQKNLNKLERPLLPVDVQATLSELTAMTVCDCLHSSMFSHPYKQLLICGGGARNADLISRIQIKLPGTEVTPVSTLGVDPDYLEALAFAWLAQQTFENIPGNSPQASGARGPRVLGGIYPA
ncbi:unnamed protein product [Cyprideis torosa]|uniref:Uncharacterized protein n=1 Tax=Cyprideis torosa TaxID=163714 RepID=A0A7R8ZWQ6_9CRUS|nr:unnamed protein product [Cyprideis torosa]CAG0905369.1 unnamed protein product [Cyprideis torosa]